MACLPGHYPLVVRGLLYAEKVELLRPAENDVLNAIFGVWKTSGKSMRLIWSGNRSNKLLRREASGFILPTSDILSTLRLDSDGNLFVACCDILQNYNRLQVSSDMVPLLGLPRVDANRIRKETEGGTFLPCVRVVPMEATFDVALAQLVNTTIVRGWLQAQLFTRRSHFWITPSLGKIPLSHILTTSTVSQPRPTRLTHL